MHIVSFMRLKTFRANLPLVLLKYISSKLILVEDGIYKIMGFKIAKITAVYKALKQSFLFQLCSKVYCKRRNKEEILLGSYWSTIVEC